MEKNGSEQLQYKAVDISGWCWFEEMDPVRPDSGSSFCVELSVCIVQFSSTLIGHPLISILGIDKLSVKIQVIYICILGLYCSYLTLPL